MKRRAAVLAVLIALVSVGFWTGPTIYRLVMFERVPHRIDQREGPILGWSHCARFGGTSSRGRVILWHAKTGYIAEFMGTEPGAGWVWDSTGLLSTDRTPINYSEGSRFEGPRTPPSPPDNSSPSAPWLARGITAETWWAEVETQK